MDYQVFTLVNQFAGRWGALDAVMVGLAKYGVLLLAIPMLVMWFRGGTDAKKAALLGLLAMAIGLAVNQVIGDIYFRVRPFAAHDVTLLIARSSDPSFPSDHATFVFAIAWMLLFKDRLIGGAALALAGLVALSRVFVGIHYPLDVIGGAGVGLVCALGVWKIRKLLDPVTGLVISIAKRVKLA